MDVPIMGTTPGITEKRFTRDPLGTEGELSDGPDDANPWRSPEEREIVEAYRAKQKEQRESGTDLINTVGVQLPFDATSNEEPTEGNDPFVFDDVDSEVGKLRLPFMENSGPEF